ncbi:MAG TPA: SHOCT domain-containing protein [Selenomonadales bacterium]|nr:SHOCT domain-containing protein [Selenomonadales bacterium]
MMMYGLGGTFGWFGMIVGMVIHLAFAVMVVLAAIWLYRSLFRKSPAETPEAEAILKQRYATGELTLEEFREMKRHLAE